MVVATSNFWRAARERSTSPINQPRPTPPIHQTMVWVGHFDLSKSKNLLKILRKLMTQTVTEDKQELYGIMNQMILDSSMLTFLNIKSTSGFATDCPIVTI